MRWLYRSGSLAVSISPDRFPMREVSREVRRPVHLPTRAHPLAKVVRLPMAQQLPKTRGDCQDAPRPCPHHGLDGLSACRFHLWRKDSGKNSSTTPPQHESCALDVADQGAHTLEQVGHVLGVTRERVRQIEEKAIAKLKAQHPDILRQLLTELNEPEIITEGARNAYATDAAE